MKKYIIMILTMLLIFSTPINPIFTPKVFASTDRYIDSLENIQQADTWESYRITPETVTVLDLEGKEYTTNNGVIPFTDERKRQLITSIGMSNVLFYTVNGNEYFWASNIPFRLEVDTYPTFFNISIVLKSPILNLDAPLPMEFAKFGSVIFDEQSNSFLQNIVISTHEVIYGTLELNSQFTSYQNNHFQSMDYILLEDRPIFEFTNVKSNQVTVSIANAFPEVARYRLRITTPREPTRTIERPITENELFTHVLLEGLKPNTQYTVYVSQIYLDNITSLELPRTTTTLTEEPYSIRLLDDKGTPYALNATINYTTYVPLELYLTTFDSAIVYINNVEIGTFLNGDKISVDLQNEHFQKNTDNSVRIEAEKNAITNQILYYFRSIDFSDIPNYTETENSDGTPQAPKRPEAGWDLVGWIKYIIDWLLYLVDSLVYLLSRLGGMITTVFAKFTTFTEMLRTFFSFLPEEVVAIMIMGMLVTVILAIFKR